MIKIFVKPFLLAQGRFLFFKRLEIEGFIFVYSKRHPYKYLHECLSTIINMVLSVQVYYYITKIITTLKMVFFNAFNEYFLIACSEHSYSFFNFFYIYYQYMINNIYYKLCILEQLRLLRKFALLYPGSFVRNLE